jgi:hypothetical protein
MTVVCTAALLLARSPALAIDIILSYNAAVEQRL